MISFVFGVKVSMSSAGTFKPGLDSYLGNITALTDINRARVEASTSKGNSVVVRGDFDFDNESDLRDSDITGFELRSRAGKLLVSVQGIPDTQFNDLDGSSADWLGQINRAMRTGFKLTSGASADLVLGLAGNDVLTTGAGNDVLRGGAGKDRLNAGAGNDNLNGGLGADIMTGGPGRDAYVVDNSQDRVIERAGGGTDTVSASTSWTLPAHVEKLILTGSRGLRGIGNGEHNSLQGNAGNNVLEGRGGNDSLDGRGGADLMRGGAGNDQYRVDRVTDRVVELAGQGNDTVSSRVSYTLPANVENLVLNGSGNSDGTGNGLANRLHGNAGDNVLAGLAGADLLTGHGGDDQFVFAHTGVHADVVTDFASDGDSLWLNPSVFALLTAGNLDPAQFRTTSGGDGNDFLVYDRPSGVLSYDPSGDGTGDLQTIVTLGPDTDLFATDIHVAVPV